jgi:hypothetical protein
MTFLALPLSYDSRERVSYELETYGTDLQHVHGTTCRNIEMASHCFRAPHTVRSPIFMVQYKILSFRQT